MCPLGPQAAGKMLNRELVKQVPGMVLQGWEAMAPRLQVQMPGEQSVLPPHGSAGVAVASSREEGGSGERTLASSWAVGSPLQVLLLGE